MRVLHLLLLLADFAVAIQVTQSEDHTQPAHHFIEELSVGGSGLSGFPADVSIPKIGYTCLLSAVASFTFSGGDDSRSIIEDLRLPSFKATAGPNSTAVSSYGNCNLQISILTNGWQYRIVGKNGIVEVNLSASIAVESRVDYSVEYNIDKNVASAKYYVTGPAEGDVAIFEGSYPRQERNNTVTEPDPGLTTVWSSCAYNDSSLSIFRQISYSGRLELPGKSEVKAGTAFFNPNSFEWRKCP